MKKNVQYYLIRFIFNNGKTIKYLGRNSHDFYPCYKDYYGIIHITKDCLKNKFLLNRINELALVENGYYELEECNDENYKHNTWFTLEEFNKIWN